MTSSISTAKTIATNLIISTSLFVGSAIVTTLWIRHQSNKRKRSQKFRIVSLCPSTTQTLYDLGLGDCVVGRTIYCPDFPTQVQEQEQQNSINKSKKKKKKENVVIPTFGGTKNPNWESIRDVAKPTHILFNMEENDYTHLPKAQTIATTLTDTPQTIQDSKEMILHLGHVFDVQQRAQEIVHQIEAAYNELVEIRNNNNNKQFTYLYFVWHKPACRVIGKGTYIGAMLEAAGGINLAVTTIDKPDSERYPLLPPNYSHVADYCFLGTEPYRFETKHIPEYEKYGHEVKLLDGEMMSWHGSSTAKGLVALAKVFSSSST